MLQFRLPDLIDGTIVDQVDFAIRQRSCCGYGGGEEPIYPRP